MEDAPAAGTNLWWRLPQAPHLFMLASHWLEIFLPFFFFSFQAEIEYHRLLVGMASLRTTHPPERSSMTTAQNGQDAPMGATDAVLKPSDPVPEDATPVKGIEFNDYAGRSITVDELLAGYTTMGFQASSVGQAVKIINEMVGVASS